jgi:riboflavin kinase/FMN adenylyltransferase
MASLDSLLPQIPVDVRGSYIAIGSFDGVHRGHARLIESMTAGAARQEMLPVVVTFFPHPSVVLRGRQPALYITTPEEKEVRLRSLGAQLVVSLPFDMELASVTAGDFLDRLESHLRMKGLFVGEDFALGYRREGNRLFLEQRSQADGFRLHVMPPLLVDGEIVSSTRVREALRSGDVRRAARYLGRPFVIPGRVIRGVGRGRRLGIPTANLEIWHERAYPGSGVYACWLEAQGSRYKAVTNIGYRPTFESEPSHPTIEAHLLDFDGDLYDRQVDLVFFERLRDERRFEGPEPLRVQIGRDIERARQMLEEEAGENGW